MWLFSFICFCICGIVVIVFSLKDKEKYKKKMKIVAWIGVAFMVIGLISSPNDSKKNVPAKNQAVETNVNRKVETNYSQKNKILNLGMTPEQFKACFQ